MDSYENMTPEEVCAHLVTALAVGFGREVTDPLLDFYWMSLSDVAPEALALAVHRASRECDFMPRPHELRELAGYGGVTSQDRAIKAWGQVRAAIASCGYCRGVDFQDQTINATIRAMGGWQTLCKSPEEWMDRFGQDRFCRTYVSVDRSGFTQPESAALPGWGDHQLPPRSIAPTYELPPLSVRPDHTSQQLHAGDRVAALVASAINHEEE